MPKYYDVEQNSEEWYELRAPRFTSSQIYRLINDRGDKLSKGAETYVYEVCENIIYPQEYFDDLGDNPIQAMQRGHDLEPLARFAYEMQTDSIVTQCGFFAENDHYGGSPDGCVQDEGGVIEIKCPLNKAKFIKYSMFKNSEDLRKNQKDYFWQCHSHINLTGSDWCDFIAFDDRKKMIPNMHIMQLERDQECIDKINHFLSLAIEMKMNILTDLKII